MQWNEIIITTTSEASDAISDMLTTVGAAGVAIEDPQDILMEVSKSDSLDYADPEFLSNLGTDVIIKAYFPQFQSLGELIPILEEKLKFVSNFLDIGKGSISNNTIDEEDWANAWKKYYNTFAITDNVTIKPSWQDVTVEAGKIVIELDPGMAFGTGTHETTKMCAVLVEKYVKAKDSVYDLGTGSGLLAIMAAKFGAVVTAMDIDEVAVRVAKENANINNVSHVIALSKGVIEEYQGPKFNVIVANIIANVIVSIAPEVLKNIEKNGLFIASGIIKERKEDVLNTYQSLGFELVELNEMGEWVAIVFKCPDTL